MTRLNRSDIAVGELGTVTERHDVVCVRILATETRRIGALNRLLRGGAGYLSRLARGLVGALTFPKYAAAASSWVFARDLASHLENCVLGLRVEF